MYQINGAAVSKKKKKMEPLPTTALIHGPISLEWPFTLRINLSVAKFPEISVAVLFTLNNEKR
jgi:hypothetical protein